MFDVQHPKNIYEVPTCARVCAGDGEYNGEPDKFHPIGDPDLKKRMKCNQAIIMQRYFHRAKYGGVVRFQRSLFIHPVDIYSASLLNIYKAPGH